MGEEVSAEEGDAVGEGGPGGAGGVAGGDGAPAGGGVGGAATRGLRLAAALGVAEGPGLIVVPDSCRDEAAAIARLVRGIEVVVVGWGGRGLAADGVSAFGCATGWCGGWWRRGGAGRGGGGNVSGC